MNPVLCAHTLTPAYLIKIALCTHTDPCVPHYIALCTHTDPCVPHYIALLKVTSNLPTVEYFFVQTNIYVCMCLMLHIPPPLPSPSLLSPPSLPPSSPIHPNCPSS